MAGPAEDPALNAQLAEYPPRTLTVDGVRRGRNREITPEEAIRFSTRGMRSFLVSWRFGAEVSSDRFADVLRAHARDFHQDGPHPPEAYAYVYGRRDPRTREDTRIVVACIGDLRTDGSA